MCFFHSMIKIDLIFLQDLFFHQVIDEERLLILQDLEEEILCAPAGSLYRSVHPSHLVLGGPQPHYLIINFILDNFGF